ncbi:MAG: EthD family reductase [Ignavibacteriae bacterium]|nr:EthD family reductase [Ignavibacteriota bacterium]MCB0723413.1 EthD family reductase [Ignavibacteriota bacterium]MCB9243259.1 EthD family reductase [Ignavibacteriales bacterium]
MTKLVALYKTPPDKELFDKKYFEEHLPLAGKMPGLVRTEVTKLKSLGADEKYYLQAEMYFDDMDSLNAAMGSPEGKAAASNLMSFAKELVVMMIGEIEE